MQRGPRVCAGHGQISVQVEGHAGDADGLGHRVARSDRDIAAIATALRMAGRGEAAVRGMHGQRSPVSWRAITRRWISLVPS